MSKKLALCLSFCVLASSTGLLEALPALAADHNSESDVAHLLGRAAFGPKPGEIEAVQRQGVEAYLQKQLHPDTITLPPNVAQLSQYDALAKDPVSLYLNYAKPVLKAMAGGKKNQTEESKKEFQKLIRETYRKVYEEAADARFTRAIDSPQELKEVMTDFWFNHFNISMEKGIDHIWVGSYEERAIRPHVLGKFRDLLGATSHHAAMLFYLDNWQNTAPGAVLVKNDGPFDQPVRRNRKNQQTLQNALNPEAAPAPKKAATRFSGINENYARELMELHTLGVDGGYTQKDVQELARVLTGLGLPPGAGGGGGAKVAMAQRAAAGNLPGGNFTNPGNPNNPGNFAGRRRMRQLGGRAGAQIRNYGATPDAIPGDHEMGYYFDARRHDNGDKVLLGQTIKGSGEGEVDQVLDLLARHPSTAKHVSYKLAQYFVADVPPQSLVDKLSKRFTETDGDIAEVMNTLLHSDEFWDTKYRGAKFKSPYRYVVSSLRATQADITEVKPILDFLKQTGQPLYQCLTPDGYKNTREAWLNPDNLLNRLNFATALGIGKMKGITTRINDPAAVADACSTDLSDKTLQSIKSSPPRLKPALVLGAPEFMNY